MKDAELASRWSTLGSRSRRSVALRRSARLVSARDGPVGDELSLTGATTDEWVQRHMSRCRVRQRSYDVRCRRAVHWHDEFVHAERHPLTGSWTTDAAGTRSPRHPPFRLSRGALGEPRDPCRRARLRLTSAHRPCRRARKHQWKTQCPGCPRAQPEERRPRDSARFARRLHGLSGSGKSSPRVRHDLRRGPAPLRRVAVSAYARQFLGQVDRPDVDFIEGLSPAVSIDQKSTNRNPRSTVGTITEIYDYMRLLWARIGVPHCPVCGEVIQRQTVQQIADQLMELPETAPATRSSPGRLAEEGRVRRPLQGARAPSGYSRADRRRRADPARPSRPTLKKQLQARHLRRRRPARRRPRDPQPRSPTRSRPRSASPTASCRSTSSTRRGDAAWQHLLREARPARTATRSSSPRSSRARSRSTRRSAPAPSARASAPGCRWTPTSARRRRRSASARASSCRGPRRARASSSTTSGCSRASPRDLDFSLDTPWGELRARRAGGRPARRQLRGHGQVEEPLRPRDEATRPASRASCPTSSASTSQAETDSQRAALVGVPARDAVPGRATASG